MGSEMCIRDSRYLQLAISPKDLCGTFANDALSHGITGRYTPFFMLEELVLFIPSQLILKPSSGQKSNDGIKSLTGIVWFELYLQTTLSAIQEYA